MFRSFFEQNPIAVRELRRLKRKFRLAGIVMLCILALYFATCFEFMFPSESPLSGISTVVSLLCFGLGIVGIIAASLYPSLSFLNARIYDEMLECVPLPADVRVHGYLFSGLPIALFSCVLFLPPIVIGLYNAITYDPIGTMLSVFGAVGALLLFSQSLASCFLAFASCVTTKEEALTARILLGWCLISLLIFNGGLLNIIFYDPVIFCLRISFFSLLTGLTGYFLARYHFSQTCKSFWRSVIINIIALVLCHQIFKVIIFIPRFISDALMFLLLL